ncbi:arginine--tRNA ligase, partial [bacterium (Candidatus Torokbacteria) CG09_land_8_20_14_0_10_42_11]
VLSGGKKMSTRGGTLIELEELFNQAKEKSKEISQAKNPEASPEELENLAEIIGLGAIIYNDLSQSRNTNIAFDWEKMLSLEGSSAIYLQYSYVRVQSILKKIIATYGEISANTLKKEEMIFADKSEFALAKKLMLFPEVIAKAQKNNSPHYVCVYLEELAQSFNSFYNAVSILKTEERKLRNSRIALISAVALVIKKGLGLLSIKAPEKM